MTMEFPSSKGLWILGDNFLQNYYTIYDMESDPKRVAFVGKVGYKEIPWNIMNYMTLIVGIALGLFIGYVIYEQCF